MGLTCPQSWEENGHRARPKPAAQLSQSALSRSEMQLGLQTDEHRRTRVKHVTHVRSRTSTLKGADTPEREGANPRTDMSDSLATTCVHSQSHTACLGSYGVPCFFCFGYLAQHATTACSGRRFLVPSHEHAREQQAAPSAEGARHRTCSSPSTRSVRGL